MIQLSLKVTANTHGITLKDELSDMPTADAFTFPSGTISPNEAAHMIEAFRGWVFSTTRSRLEAMEAAQKTDTEGPR